MSKITDVLQSIRPEFDFAASNDFITDGMLDSYDMVMLVSELDKTFSIKLAGTDIVPANFRNIATIEQLIRRYGKEL